MDHYGVNMEIPAFYMLDAKAYPGDPAYCVQIVRYVLPKQVITNGQAKKIIMKTYDKDGNMQVDDMENVFNANKYYKTSLKLMKEVNNTFEEVVEVPIRFNEVTIDFSPCGQYLAVLARNDNNLTVYSIPEKNVESLFMDENNEVLQFLHNN